LAILKQVEISLELSIFIKLLASFADHIGNFGSVSLRSSGSKLDAKKGEFGKVVIQFGILIS
jgi:hypothetical protein